MEEMENRNKPFKEKVTGRIGGVEKIVKRSNWIQLYLSAQMFVQILSLQFMMVNPPGKSRENNLKLWGEANTWTSSDKTTALVLSLREEALDVLQALDERKKTTTTWSSI